MLATGALAACGGGSTASPPPTASPLCPDVAAAIKGIADILSDPVFAGVDQTALTAFFDLTTDYIKFTQGYFALTGQQPQRDNVIRSIPPGGIVIDAPGTYTLAGDIGWTPSTGQCAAISIQCNDVTLDFAGWTLRASGADTSQRIAGVVVGSPLSAGGNVALGNVQIKNGTIANIPEYGILGTGVCGLAVSGMTVRGVCMNNTSIPYETPVGIFIGSSENVTISDCSVTGMNVTTASCAGIMLMRTIGGTVNGCTADSLTNNDGAVQGFSCISSINVATTKCTASNLQSFNQGKTTTSGHTILGFCPILCYNLTYVDCSAVNMIGCCDDCHGMSIFIDAQVTVSNFHADTVVDGPPPYNTGAKATGLEVYGAGVTVLHSTVTNIHANNPQDLQSTGFSAWGKDIHFVDCHASNVTVTDDYNKGCLAEGFGWAPDPRTKFGFPRVGAYNVTYYDCTADSCAIGFDSWMHQDSTWSNLTITNCATPILVQPPGTQRTVTCDACSECSPSLSTQVVNIAQNNTFPP